MFRNDKNTKSLYSYTLFSVLLISLILNNPNNMVGASNVKVREQQQRMLEDIGNEGARITLYVFFFGTIGCIMFSLCRLYSRVEVEEPLNLALKKDDSMDDEPTRSGPEKSLELPETSIV